jgi:hypothetical protein
VTVRDRWVRAAHGADAEQAACLRRSLADELEQTRLQLARSHGHLRACTAGNHVVGLRAMARARAEVRALEATQKELDRMIVALDRRFSATWLHQR